MAKRVCAIAWSRDGSEITSIRATTARRWSAQDGAQLSRAAVATLPCDDRIGHWLADDGSIAMTNTNSMLRLWDPQTGRSFVTLAYAPAHNDAWLVVSPEGHYCGSKGVEDEIVYVAETDAGQETLSPAEFSKRFGWKNDPTHVSMLPQSASFTSGPTTRP
jgi:hypothetical protein